MNIDFPEAQNTITTLEQIGITRLIAFLVCLLDWMQERVLRRVAVPKVTVPLNDDFCFWYKHVNNKLGTNYLLLHVVATHLIKDGGTCLFQPIQSFLGGEMQKSFNSALFFTMISTSHRTKNVSCIEPSTLTIEGCSARFALNNTPCAAFLKFLLALCSSSLGSFLPQISACGGTETWLVIVAN